MEKEEKVHFCYSGKRVFLLSRRRGYRMISPFLFFKGSSDSEPESSQQICRKEKRWSLLQTLIYLSPKGG